MYKSWCYQLIELKELRNGLFHDAAINREIAQSCPFARQQLLGRACKLVTLHGWQGQFERLAGQLAKAAFILLLIACFMGASAGLAALGSPGQPVNVIWSLLGLLLMPTATMLIWLVSLALPASSLPWLGQLLQRVMNQFMIRSTLADAWQAWIELARNARTLQLWVAMGSHIAWCGLMVGALAAMAMAFSLRHYTFVWETTWLPVDVFVAMATGLGKLSSWLGLTMPDAQAIAASGNRALDDPQVRIGWANWLVGSIFVIGLVPRLAAIVCCISMIRLRHRRYSIQTESAYAQAVLAQIQQDNPVHECDGPPGVEDTWSNRQDDHPVLPRDGSIAVVGLEVAALPDWIQGNVVLGIVADRQSRDDVMSQLRKGTIKQLLVVVDAGQTPDRGTLSLARDMAGQVAQSMFFLLPRQNGPDRSALWVRKLTEVGLPAPIQDTQQALRWISG